MTVDLTLLHPALLPLYVRLRRDLTAKGYICYAIQGFRTAAEENALPGTATSVTSSTSKHCFILNGKPAAKAFDMGFFDAGGKYVANGADQRYTDAGALWLAYGAEPANRALGLLWGGVWHKPHDPDHFQIA